MTDAFVEAVICATAARVANRCSNPNCRALTSGPHNDRRRSLTLGLAVHIAAAEHFAARDKWGEALRRGDDKCCRPYDLRPDEGIGDYSERKMDEWAEKDCFFKGWFDGRSVREAQQIEDQCKRDVEITRLRKAVERSLKK